MWASKLLLLLLFYSFEIFFIPRLADGLSDSKSPQVSRTLLSILASLNSAVVWMVFTCPLISKSSSPWINHWVTVPSSLITIGINIIFMFYCFFSSLARLWYLSLFSFSFSFTLWSAEMAKSTLWQVPFFCWLSLGLVVWLRLGDPFVSQTPREICLSPFPGQILGYTYTICSYGRI